MTEEAHHMKEIESFERDFRAEVWVALMKGIDTHTIIEMANDPAFTVEERKVARRVVTEELK